VTGLEDIANSKIMRLDAPEARNSKLLIGIVEKHGFVSSNEIGEYAKTDVPENVVPMMEPIFRTVNAVI